jgi:gliding motility-associated-like protein
LNGACADTAFATVQVIPVAQMAIVPSDTIICPGQSVQLNLTYTPGVEEIMWMPADGLSCSDCDNPVATPAGTTNYNVTGTFMGCQTGTSAIVQVRPAPGYEFPNDTLLCLGESITLNQVNDPTASYTWTSTDPTFGTVNSAQPTVTPLQNATYFLSANNGCPARDTLTVRVFSAGLILSNDTTICKNLPVQLSASGTLPGTYQWSSGQTGQVINVTPAETTVYSVQYTYGDNCTISNAITVNVDGEAPVLVFPSDLNICPGDSIQLNSFVVQDAVYAWTSTPAGFTSSSPTPVVAPLQTTTYNVTATLGACATITQVVINTSNPQLSISNDTTICAGESVMLRATATPGGGTFVWAPGGQGSTITVQPATTTNYLAQYTFGDNCVKTDSVLVSVVPNFMLSILSEPDTNRLDIGTPLELSAAVQPAQNLGGFSFTWEENGVQEVGDESLYNTVISTNDTVLFYRLTAVSSAGCEQVAVISFIVVQPEVLLPNAFTPNGDGTNDSFGLIVREGTATIDIMQIYNRWGQLVFESTDPAARWDGRSDGKDQASDTYLYVVRWRRADGALQPVLQGDLLLLR